MGKRRIYQNYKLFNDQEFHMLPHHQWNIKTLLNIMIQSQLSVILKTASEILRWNRVKKQFSNSYTIELKNYFQIAPKYKNLDDTSWRNEMVAKWLFRITIHRDTPLGTNKIQTIS